MKLKVQGVEVKSGTGPPAPPLSFPVSLGTALLWRVLVPVTPVERILVCQDPACFLSFSLLTLSGSPRN